MAEEYFDLTINVAAAKRPYDWDTELGYSWSNESKYSHRLFNMLPNLAKHIDQRHGSRALEHFCDAYQAHIDEVLYWLENRAEIYNLDSPASHPFLDWYGQFFGLSVQPLRRSGGVRWEGIGINPKWSIEHKKTIITRAWNYWQNKGSRWAIQEAIELWLRYPGHDPKYFIQLQPFGTKPTANPPKWFSYATPYDYNNLATHSESKTLGSGDYFQFDRLEHGTITTPWAWDYSVPFNQIGTVQQVPSATERGSEIWVNNLWEYFWLQRPDDELRPDPERDWYKIRPYIDRLNPEMVAGNVQPTVWNWITFDRIPPRKIKPPLTDGDNNHSTEYRWEPDGFKYWDLFPVRYKEPSTIERQVTTQINYRNPVPYAFQWGESFGLKGGITIPGSYRDVTIYHPGNPLNQCFEYTDVFTTITPGEAITTVNVPSNLDDCASYFGDYTQEFYRAAMDIPMVDHANPNTQYCSQYTTPYSREFYAGYRQLTITEYPYHPQVIIGRAADWYADQRSETISELIPGSVGQTTAEPSRQWYSGLNQYSQRKTETIFDPGYPCRKGMENWIEDGMEDVIIPGNPGIDANQLWEIVDESTETITTPSVDGVYGLSYSSPFLATGFSYYNALENIPELALSFPSLNSLPRIEYSITDAYYRYDIPIAITDTEQWYSNGYPETTETTTIPGGHKLVSPYQIALWNSRYGYASPWYNQGIASTSDAIETVPKYKPANICNVRDDWTLYKIEWWEVVDIQLPEDVRSPSQIYPELRNMNARGQWRLYLETTAEHFILSQPQSMFWFNPEQGINDRSARSDAYSVTKNCTSLAVEFVIHPKTGILKRNPDAVQLLSVQLTHGAKCIHHRQFFPPADISPTGFYGFRYIVPVQLPVVAQ